MNRFNECFKCVDERIENSRYIIILYNSISLNPRQHYAFGVWADVFDDNYIEVSKLEAMCRK